MKCKMICIICGKTKTTFPLFHKSCLKKSVDLVNCGICNCVMNRKHAYNSSIVVGMRTRHILSCSDKCSKRYFENPKQFLKGV